MGVTTADNTNELDSIFNQAFGITSMDEGRIRRLGPVRASPMPRRPEIPEQALAWPRSSMTRYVTSSST